MANGYDDEKMAAFQGPGPTRNNRSSDVPRWQVWLVGAILLVLVGVPVGILWWKLVQKLLGL